MNERIFELWEQSTGAAVPEEGFYSSASKYNIEKFAELIVQECMLVITEQSENIHAEGTIEAIVNLEKYFGVEE